MVVGHYRTLLLLKVPLHVHVCDYSLLMIIIGFTSTFKCHNLWFTTLTFSWLLTTVFHIGFCKSVLLLVIVSILSTFKINMFSL